MKYDLTKAPAVSGTLNYIMCLRGCKSDEHRPAELEKRRQYQSPQQQIPRKIATQSPRLGPNRSSGASQPKQGQGSTGLKLRRCWNCGETRHVAYNCLKPKKESPGHKNYKPTSTKIVSSTEPRIPQEVPDDPLQYLLSDPGDPGDVRQVRVQDSESKPQRARVVVGGVLCWESSALQLMLP